MVLTPRDVQLATESISPENIDKELAKFARAELAKAIDGGEASSIYEKFINGREGDEEETVQAPGPILYVFSYWEPVIKFALAALSKRSPVRTGRYRDTVQVMIGSQRISPDAPISAGETVSIVSTQPYSRKIEVGYMVIRDPGAGVFQAVRQQVQSQFGKALEVKFVMRTIPGGYILKGVFRRGVKPGARKKLAKDTAAGATMTYPSLEMRFR